MTGAATVPYARRVLRLLRGRAWGIVVFVVIVVLFEALRSWTVDYRPGDGDAFYFPLFVIPLWALVTGAVLVPILVEATGLHGLTLGVVVTLATMTVNGVIALAIAALHTSPLAPGIRDGIILSNPAFLYRSWWLYTAAALLFAVYCHAREREQAALLAARDAELERAGTQREIVASRLKVLQARVEPSLLFDALADVRTAYLRDPPAAGALLDDLVTYLRAALPQMRGGASSVAREVALADAYLRVVPAGRNKRLVTQTSVDPAAIDADFPPMVLLPLVHAAADAGSAHIAVDASRDADRVVVRVRAHGAVPVGWDGEALDVVRETVLQYFGREASLRVKRAGDAAEASVEWPVRDASTGVAERAA